MRAELHGELGAILALGEAGIKNRTPDVGVRLSVVAGAGFGTYLTSHGGYRFGEPRQPQVRGPFAPVNAPWTDR